MKILSRKILFEAVVNGIKVRVDVDPSSSLLEILRRDLGLTGAKNGCNVGICGTCHVIINGALKKACIVPVEKANGGQILTVEGVGCLHSTAPGSLAPIQRAFINNTASQCGMCTSGFIVACHYFLQRNQSPVDRDQIRTFLRKDFCRCTGYEQIVDAVQEAAGLGKTQDFLKRTFLIRRPENLSSEALSLLTIDAVTVQEPDGLYARDSRRVAGRSEATGSSEATGRSQVADAPDSPPHTWIGRFVPQYNAMKKVTGGLRYADDLPEPAGMLHLAAVRSPYASARLVRIDKSKAEACPGVVGVLTAADLPAGDNYVGMLVRDQRILVPVGESVKAVGDVVALVAAEDLLTAREAAGLVMADYEEISGVFDAEEALKPGAPVVHPEIKNPPDPSRPNLVHLQHIHKGEGIHSEADMDRIFEQGAIHTQRGGGEASENASLSAGSQPLLVIEGTYFAPFQDHAPLEPEVALAHWDEEKKKVVVSGPVQHVFFARRNIREALGMENSQVRVIGTPVGGAYGKREDPYAHPYVALATLLLKRPTKMLWTREETLQYTQKRHSLRAYFKAAVTRDGKIVAFKARTYLDGGAYRSWTKEVTTKSAVMCTGPYEIPYVWIDAHGVYTNNPLCGACRGFGTTNTIFCTEVFWNKVAKSIGMDPYRFRRLNSFRKGSLTATRHHLAKGVRSIECMDAATKVSGWNRPLEKRRDGDWVYGRGMASIWYGNGFGRGIRDEGCPIIEISQEGRVVIHASTVDYGQGSNTVFQQVAAEVLGAALEEIDLHTADSDTTPNCNSTVASRVTVVVGKAVEMTARALRQDLFAVAAPLLGAKPEELESFQSRIWPRSNPSRSVTFKEVASSSKEPLLRQVPKLQQEFTSPLDPATGEGKAYWPYVFGTHCCTVGVNVRTGQVKILEYTAAHDVGKVINPQACRGQIIGGTAMGVGFALTEELVVEKGKVITNNFDTYSLPRATDLPDMNVIMLEDPEIEGDLDFGPKGAKGIGEPPTVAPAPAIVNAINDALMEFGAEITEIPVTPKRIKAQPGLWGDQHR